MVLVFLTWAPIPEGTGATRAPAVRMRMEGRSIFLRFFSGVQLFAHRGYGSKEDDHPTDDGGQPVIDLGPINDTSDQPQPDHAGNDADPKPDTYGPGEPVSPPRKPDTGIDPNVDNNPPEGSTPEKYPNPDESTPPSPKSAPDPANGEGRPYIPVFLGPSNNDPSHGSSHPPYDASHDSDHPSDGGRDRYTDDYPCGGPFGESLINVLSNNGGDGGDASSGSATSIEYGGDGSSSAYSGAGGNASGGSVYAAPALVNILSDNGGDGGNAASGDSYSATALPHTRALEVMPQAGLSKSTAPDAERYRER
ncbi:hypothetical protein F5148DRAFT_791266 [Russula earlei]|uniref:Uncharacterized protein n=1 Tax=Russula earlei TaxID=71964 RepID=A0ACC0UMU3_9AGAM|nr:hypothetical protein F5148DRAFT_791266 [Russula earlei]